MQSISCQFFVCLLLYPHSFGQSSIDIRKPPSIIRGPRSSVIYRNDDRVNLECKGQGVPTVSYEWRKNGLPLNLNGPNIRTGSDGSITITSATASDEGFYQCLVKNQYGTALTITSHVQRAVLDATESVNVLHKTVQEGSPFFIQAGTVKSFPKPTYGWGIVQNVIDRFLEPIRTSQRIQIAENGDLHFAYALPEDNMSGRLYKSTLYNPYLDIMATGMYTNLTVTRAVGGVTPFAPALQFSSPNVTVAVVGGSVSLRCFFSGNTVPTISWTGPRNTLPIGRYTLAKHNTELIINNITESDEGDYKCTGSNAKGTNQKTLQIRVEAVPKFKRVSDSPHNIDMTEGDSVIFNCDADARPDAEIVWLMNGVMIDVINPPRRFVFSSDKKTLKIRDLCRDCTDRSSLSDLMVIQCNASNVHGYAFGSGYINVLSKTKVILRGESQVSVDRFQEKKLDFGCTATSDPSTPPSVRWYKVEYDQNVPVYDDPPYVTIRNGTLTIHVTPTGTVQWTKYEGEYRCIADNGYSKDNVTVSLRINDFDPIAIYGGDEGL